MMDVLTVIIYGALLELALIMPLGMQNVYLFNQGAATQNMRDVLPSIVTACVCDSILIVAAIFGVSLLFVTYPVLKSIILGFGTVFLVYIGWATYKQASADFSQKARVLSWQKQIIFAASVSLFNPHAIIDSVAIIGTTGNTYEDFTLKMTFMLSAITVSWMWLSGITYAGHCLMKLPYKDKIFLWVNHGAAIIMWVAAIYLGKEFVEAVEPLLR